MTGTAPIQINSTCPPIPQRSDNSHKGDFGRVLLIAGSRGMSGAACLAGKSALRTGVGLATVASPMSIINVVAAYEPSYMTLELAEDDHGRIQKAAIDQIAQVLPRQTAVGIGPGIGQSAALQELVSDLYMSMSLPAVFDADALNLLARRPYLLKRPTNAPARVLTPHVGEFARLTGYDAVDIQENRVKYATEFARKHHLIVVLKGRNTVITDGDQFAINTTGNSGMATGGTGDVLTGVIASFLAQGIPAFEAARLGAHIQGYAGDLAANEYSKPGMIASDLPQFLGRALKQLEQK